MARLEVRVNPAHGADVEADEYDFSSSGTEVFTDAEDLQRLQASAEFRAYLIDALYDSNTTSTLQILDGGGGLIDQDDALRFLSKAAAFDFFRQRFTNAAARLADATTYIADDLYSFGLQEDDGSIWFLSAISPSTVWTLFKAGAAQTTGRTVIRMGWVTDGQTPYTESAPSAAWQHAAYVPFPGTNELGSISTIEFIAWMSKTPTDAGGVRVVDVGSGLVVASSSTLTATSPQYFDLGTIDNLSGPPAIWRVEFTGDASGGAKTRLASIRVVT
jgi:hypothetical protein